MEEQYIVQAKKGSGQAARKTQRSQQEAQTAKLRKGTFSLEGGGNGRISQALKYEDIRNAK